MTKDTGRILPVITYLGMLRCKKQKGVHADIERQMTGSDTKNSRRLMILVQLILLIVLTTPQIQAENRENEQSFIKEIRLATVQDIYSSINHHDARTALELIMQKTIAKKSYAYKVQMHFIDPAMNNIVEDLQGGGYHFITLSGLDYFAYRDTLNLNPILIPTKTDQPTENLVLLARKDQTLSTMAEKPERTLLIETGRSGDLSKLWLDTRIPVEGFPQSDFFFTEIRRVKKPNRAVIPVFFNQADACVVTQNAFDILNDLNPQIGRRLKVLFRSKGLVRMMVCATQKPNPKDIEAFVKESVNIEHNPDTQQAMTIIQMKRFLQVNPGDLEATQKLILSHRQITMK